MAESGPHGGSRATDRALQIAAIDLFVVPTISFKLLYDLVIPLHGRRRATISSSGCGTGKRARKRSQRGDQGSAAHDFEALPNNPAAVLGRRKALADFCEITTETPAKLSVMDSLKP